MTEPSPSRPPLRHARPAKDAGLPGHDKVFSVNPHVVATREDQMTWAGFCEIESEPANFNYMLEGYGVKDVRVQEVYSLDDESLASLPQPVYGLIFLFKWRQDHENEQEQSCPTEIWFANQTVGNACATVALLNIVNNVPQLDLGPHLQCFKDFTNDFSPALKGDAVANFEFAKQIHNSLARKLDMLNIDLLMKECATTKAKAKKNQSNGDDQESAFHFVAYMPVNGDIWKFDGLQRQPQKLGSLDDEDWLSRVKPDIEARIAQYEEGQIEFAIMSLVKDPLIGFSEELAQNVRDLTVLSTRRPCPRLVTKPGDSQDPGGGPQGFDDEVVLGPHERYGLSQSTIDASEASAEILEIAESGADAVRQTALARLIAEQGRLRIMILEEVEARTLERKRVECRQHDFSPLVRKVAEIVAKRNVAEFMKESKGKRAKKRG